MISLNHVGYIVENIEDYKNSLPPMKSVRAVYDPIQNSKIELLRVNNGSCVELIQPLNSTAFTWNFLKKNGEGLHHLCYEGYTLSELDSMFRASRMIKLRGPIPAVLFDRDVVFAITRNRSIVEFIL